MLPITVKILQEKLGNVREVADTAKIDGGYAGDGDGYHDEAFLLAEQRFHLSKIMAASTADLLERAEIMPVPDQFHSVAVGHAVIVSFKNDSLISAGQTVVHLVSTADRQALQEYFKKHPQLAGVYDNGDSALVVSVDSPLGQALINMKRGEVGSYIGLDEVDERKVYRFSLADTDESIGVTPLFYLES